MYRRKRIRYEYQTRSLLSFINWFYIGVKAYSTIRVHNTFSKFIGEEKYLRFLKKLRCRKLSEDNFIEIIEINPDNVKYISPTREEQKWYSTGKIKRGNWDQKLDLYNKLPFHQATIKRIIENKNWSEIEEVGKAREGGIKWPGKPYKVDRDIEKTEELLNSIQKEGFKTQEEIKNVSYEEAEKNWDLSALNEVCVDLDREGNPLFVDGRHRLSIAKILGIEKIPARVVMRHSALEK